MFCLRKKKGASEHSIECSVIVGVEGLHDGYTRLLEPIAVGIVTCSTA